MPPDYKENSIGDRILCHLGEKTIELSKLGLNIAFNTHAFLDGTYGDTKPPSDYYDTLRQMKKTGYLKEKQGQLYITEKGRIKKIKKVLKNKPKKEKKKWDGKWRGVMFDIPEASRKDRDFLRKELRQLGLMEVQKSVWVSPFNIERELKTLLKLWTIDFKGDIRFFVIEKMNDNDLKERFDIK